MGRCLPVRQRHVPPLRARRLGGWFDGEGHKPSPSPDLGAALVAQSRVRVDLIGRVPAGWPIRLIIPVYGIGIGGHVARIARISVYGNRRDIQATEQLTDNRRQVSINSRLYPR